MRSFRYPHQKGTPKRAGSTLQSRSIDCCVASASRRWGGDRQRCRVVRGFIGHTDRGWWEFLSARPVISEVNFWRPGGRGFGALAPGEPFFFRLKSPVNRIGGFGLFARAARLPVWRAWEVFGEANGVSGEAELIERATLLTRRPISRNHVIGCVAVAECTFFAADSWLPVPSSFRPQNLSGAVIDLDRRDGRDLWTECLELAAGSATAWARPAADDARHGRPIVIRPRLGQGSFRLAVLDAYAGSCAVTGEHALPALEAAHIQPYAVGGRHELANGLVLRRDLHRLFDLGYVSARRDGRFLVSPRLRSEFHNGETYYALEGRRLRLPADVNSAPSADLLDWHSQTVFQAA
jgi:putative restriction endonuclease